MAGGIFPNYPFELNAKCVIFSLIIIGLFFYCPPKMELAMQLMLCFILFVVAYVAMAWYDYEFQCMRLPLKKSGSGYGITGLFKPTAYAASQTDRNAMTDDEVQLDMILIHLLHLIVIAPVVFLVGWRGIESPRWAIIMLIAILSFAMLYHGVRVARHPYYFIGWMHIIAALVIIPLLVIRIKLPAFFYALIFTAFYVAIKHGFSLIQISHNNQNNHHDDDNSTKN